MNETELRAIVAKLSVIVRQQASVLFDQGQELTVLREILESREDGLHKRLLDELQRRGNELAVHKRPVLQLLDQIDRELSHN